VSACRADDADADVPNVVHQDADADVLPKSVRVVVLTNVGHVLAVGQRDVVGQNVANVPRDIAVGLRIGNK